MAQSNYVAKYNKDNYKMYQFRVRRNDSVLIDRLDSIDNRNSYIANLIRDDINPGVLTIKQIKQKIKPVMKKHGVDEIYLFGSYARGEATRDSDVDIYCSSGDIKTLLDETSFVEELEAALGKKVDVVTIGSNMHEYFKQQLQEDMIKLI